MQREPTNSNTKSIYGSRGCLIPQLIYKLIAHVQIIHVWKPMWKSILYKNVEEKNELENGESKNHHYGINLSIIFHSSYSWVHVQLYSFNFTLDYRSFMLTHASKYSHQMIKMQSTKCFPDYTPKHYFLFFWNGNKFYYKTW